MEKPNNCNYDFRENKTEEDIYISELLADEELFIFASTLIFNYLQKCKDVGFSKKDTIDTIKVWYFNIIVIKMGYNCDNYDCNTLIDITNLEEFIQENKRLGLSLSDIMGALYKFQTNNDFTLKCIEKDSKLKKLFVNNVKEYFCLDKEETFETIKKTVDESSGYWFYLWVITFVGNKNRNLLHNNLINDEDYIRKWNKNIEFSGSLNMDKYKTRILETDDVKYNEMKNYDYKNIMLGCTYFTIKTDTFWFNNMKKYKKQVIAGPSSSSVLTYQMIFKIAKIIPETDVNKFLLLKCILVHYYDFFHSISEVLQEYTVDSEFNDYNLSMNDIEYMREHEIKILNPKGSFGGKKHKTKKNKNKSYRKSNKRIRKKITLKS